MKTFLVKARDDNYCGQTCNQDSVTSSEHTADAYVPDVNRVQK